MKIVSFSILFAGSAMFLSCDNDITDTNGTVRCKIVAEQNYKDSYYEAAYEEISKKLDPSCKSEQKNLVRITYDIKINWDYVYSHAPKYVPGSGEVSIFRSMNSSGYGYCNINGVDMTLEECEVYDKEYEKKYQEELSKNAIKDLQILCSVGNGPQIWEALLTNEEIAELKRTYDGIQISYYKDSVRGGNPTPGYNPPTGDESGNNCR